MRNKLETSVNHLKLRFEISLCTILNYLLLPDEKHGKSMVLQSTVDTRVGLLKDNYVQMDMEHRRQEQRIENLRKQKEEEVGLGCFIFITELM